MAGNYMDAPSDRLAWDRDGSLLSLISSAGVVSQQPAAVRRLLNGESEDAFDVSSVRYIAVVFPVPTDCVAVFVRSASGITEVSVQTSKDTTNGLDGTWSDQYLNKLTTQGVTRPDYRSLGNLWFLQTNSSSSDLRGIRLLMNNSSGSRLKAFHIYGVPSTLATKNRLIIRHPTQDIRVSPEYFDWGNVQRSSSGDRSFRIKNLSDSLRATDIDVYVEALTPGTPSVSSMHTISMDGGSTFSSTQIIPKLEPGESSGVLILRRVIPDNAQVSVWSARLAADVNLWEEI